MMRTKSVSKPVSFVDDGFLFFHRRYARFLSFQRVAFEWIAFLTNGSINDNGNRIAQGLGV
jgi:hypothetical protein